MLSILVCHSYFLRFDHKQLERAKPYPPLATLQVASMLRQAGHAVALFDAMLAEGTQDFERLLSQVSPQLVLFYEDNYNFLSKMCLGKMRRAACEMLSHARREHTCLIAAGSDATDAPEAYLRAGADAVLIGEGLSALLALVSRLDARPDAAAGELTAGLPGLAVLSRGELSVSQGGMLLRNLPHAGFPAWDLVDMERYRDVWRTAHGFFSLNMAASRGCPFRCNWCAKPIWGNQYLQRDAAEVAAEMGYLRRTFEPDHIWFADDIFGFRADWVRDFAHAAHAEGGPIPFTIQTRADIATARMATELRHAGCREAWIGAESGSQRILDAMNKGTRVGEVIAARARLKAAGIRVGFFIQLGYLGEELNDILETRKLIELTCPDDIGVSVSYPLPGTKFYDMVKEQLGAQTHWSESDDLAMMFRGTYSSGFYRTIRDLLHEQVVAERLNDGAHAEAFESARAGLQRRWSSLLSREAEFRTAVGWQAGNARAEPQPATGYPT
jgi:anaerobic magnesium-protoporphyrin IX monomethyl ester cyclase